MACATPADWRTALERFAAAEGAELRLIGDRARAYAATTYSPEAFVDRLDRMFASIGMKVD